MMSLLLLGILVLAASYRTPSSILLSRKKPPLSIVRMAPIGSKEMFNVFIDSMQETNEGNDTIHTPRKWSKSKVNDDTNASKLQEEFENLQLTMKDSTLTQSKKEIFEIFIESDDDCKGDECVLDTPDAWKKGANKSTKPYDEMKEETKSKPFWLDDNDSTSDRDDTPLAWKKKKK